MRNTVRLAIMSLFVMILTAFGQTPVLQVDVGPDGQTVQSGWSGFGFKTSGQYNDYSRTNTYGTYTVTMNIKDPSYMEWRTPTFGRAGGMTQTTLPYMYDDGLTMGVYGSIQYLEIYIQGLKSNQIYAFDMWNWDPRTNGVATAWIDWTRGSGAGIVWMKSGNFASSTNAYPASDSDSKTTFLISSAADGSIKVRGTGSGPAAGYRGIFNGFQLTENADPISLKWDFGSSGTQPTGWKGGITWGEMYSPSTNTFTQDAFSMQVMKYAGDWSLYGTGDSSPSFGSGVTLGAMYKDGIGRSTWGQGDGWFGFRFLNLKPSQQYDVDIWHWSASDSSTTWYDTTSGSDVPIKVTAGMNLGTNVLTSDAGTPASDTDYWSRVRATANASGIIEFKVYGMKTPNPYKINGMTTTEYFPPPPRGTIVLLK